MRGTTFESSTCDYSDDPQILLESGGKNRERGNEASQNQKHSKRRLADNTGQHHIITPSSYIKMSSLLEKDEDDKMEKSNLATVVAEFIQMLHVNNN